MRSRSLLEFVPSFRGGGCGLGGSGFGGGRGGSLSGGGDGGLGDAKGGGGELGAGIESCSDEENICQLSGPAWDLSPRLCTNAVLGYTHTPFRYPLWL